MPNTVAYVGPLVATATAMWALAGWMWLRRDAGDARAFAGFLAVLGLWAVIAALRTVRFGPPIDRTLPLVFQLVAWTIPVGWVLFVLRYMNREHWLTQRVTVAGLGVYLAAILLTATSPLHHLVLLEPTLAAEPFPHYVNEPARLYWLFLGLTYGTILGGVALLLHQFVLSRNVSRTQPLLLVLGVASPLLVDPLTTLGILSGPSFAHTPISLSLFGVFATVAVFRHRLFAIGPVARDVAFESVDEAILVLDADRRVVDFNDAAREVFTNLSEAVGRPIEDAYPDLRSDDEFVSEYAMVTESGERRFSVSNSSVTAGGRTRGHVLVLSDVTELLQRTRDLRQQTDQLDRFASVVSHDLRNPLTVASGRIDLALETGDVEHLRDAGIAVDRMNEIIEDALTLAREGEVIEEYEHIDLLEAARRSWQMISGSQATLRLEVENPVTVRGDAGRIQTLFENLFRNAIEHAGDDVTVTVGASADGFYVEDDGPGIPEDTREDAFEEGFSTSGVGTGFGLSIVESVANAHGWTVSIEEGTEGGARFVFSDVEILTPEADGEHSSIMPTQE